MVLRIGSAAAPLWQKLDRLQAMPQVHEGTAREEVSQVSGEGQTRHLRPVPIVISNAPRGLDGVQIAGGERVRKHRMPSTHPGIQETHMRDLRGVYGERSARE